MTPPPIRPAKSSDAKSIADIYNHYIINSTATFEEEQVTGDDIKKRISETQNLKLPWLVYEDGGKAIGYAYASKWKGRCAYRYSVEITVYLHPDAGGKGLGTQLYRQLFQELKALGYHVVIGGITLPNPASIALHEKMGLTHMGTFKDVGYKFEQWIDVGYWQGKLDEILSAQA